MTAPSRRWIRFAILTLAVAVTVSACMAWWARDSWTTKGPDDEFVVVAEVGDIMPAFTIVGLLKINDIDSGFEGSLTYSVSVPRRDARQACKLIRGKSSKLGPYLNWIADY